MAEAVIALRESAGVVRALRYAHHSPLTLRVEWLEKLLSGTLGYRLRPWLDARMPAFRESGLLIARGLALDHGLPSDPVLRTDRETPAAGGGGPPLEPNVNINGHPGLGGIEWTAI